jgi:hypothetical protein
MQRSLMAMVLVVATMSLAAAQDANSPAQQDGAQSAQAGGSGQAILVELTKTLDAKKLKAGDPVSARTMQEMRASDGTAVAVGSMVKGHITAATSKAKGDPQSSIAIAFDNIVLKNGQQLPLQAGIQAVGAPPIISLEQYGGVGSQPTMTNPGSPNPPGTLSPTGPMGGGAPVTGFPQPQPNSPPGPTNQGNSPGSGGLTTQSTGVVGLRNIELQPNSTLTSSGKDLKLDSGTELILRVQSR